MLTIAFREDEAVAKRMELLKEYEKFLHKKNYDIGKLRATAGKHIDTKKKLYKKSLNMLKKGSKKKEKTKEDYKKILRHYYMGNEQEVVKVEEDVEVAVERKWYEWTYCYAFKNPDAQKKEHEVHIDDAFEHIDGLFKEMPMANDIQKTRMHSAHQEVVREMLDKLADEDGNIKKYKGGRFEKIPEEEEKDELVKPKKKEFDISPKWIDHGAEPRDLTTLVFNIFLHKINVGLSLESRTVMSVDGNHIYVVIRADDGDLKNIAEETNYTMQLAIGLTDLSSLEPCDQYYRPLRK